MFIFCTVHVCTERDESQHNTYQEFETTEARLQRLEYMIQNQMMNNMSSFNSMQHTHHMQAPHLQQTNVMNASQFNGQCNRFSRFDSHPHHTYAQSHAAQSHAAQSHAAQSHAAQSHAAQAHAHHISNSHHTQSQNVMTTMQPDSSVRTHKHLRRPMQNHHHQNHYSY